jgi:hypothetical protein
MQQTTTLSQVAPAASEFGINWGTLGIVALLILGLMLAVRLIGQLAAATHGGGAPAAGAVAPGAAAPGAGAAPAAALAGVAGAEDLDAETAAIIAAAVACYYFGRGRVVGITEVTQRHFQMQQAWSMEGRRQIAQSHKLR